MAKKILNFLTVLTLSIYFTACSDDDSSAASLSLSNLPVKNAPKEEADLVDEVVELEEVEEDITVEDSVDFEGVEIVLNFKTTESFVPLNDESCESEDELNYQCNLYISNQEYIENGSFEEGHDLGQNKWKVFAEIDGWSADLDLIDAPIEIQNGSNIGSIEPYDGTSKLEMDSHAKDGFSESDATVYQEVETEIGEFYLITFYYSPRTNNNSASNSVSISWAGDFLEEVSSETVGWQKYQFLVSASDTVSRLEFSATPDSDTLGAYIDLVSVKKFRFN